MSSEAPPPQTSGTRTRGMAQGSDPDARPRVTEALAPLSSDAPSPSEPAPPEPSEVRVRTPPRRVAQGSDTDAHPHVAEAPPPAARSSSRRPKFRFISSIRAAHSCVAEPVAPPPSATRTVPDSPLPSDTPLVLPRRNPPRAASIKASQSSMTSSAQHSDVHNHRTKAKALSLASSSPRGRSSARGPPAGSALCDKVVGSTSTEGTVPKVSVKPIGEKKPCQMSIKANDEEKKDHECDEVVGSTSAKGTVPKVSVKPIGEKNPCHMLTKANDGEKQEHQLSPHLQCIVSNHSKIWSDKVDAATNSFRTTMKAHSSDKLWRDKVDEASLSLAATLKEIQNEQSGRLLAELAKELNSATDIKKLALIYDERMLLHIPQGSRCVEIPSRLTSIINRLQKENLIDRCDLFECDEATVESLLAVHTPSHVEDIQSISSKNQEERNTMAYEHCPEGDIYYSEGSGKAALIAAGGTIKACSLVAEHKYQYSFAIVRPPGHHVGIKGPTGFCLFNNIAIGASHLLEHYKMKRVLIVDWDIHHGNGTEEIFYKDERVLFFSVHRHDKKFYPRPPVGKANKIGEGSGTGFNVNVCWPHNKIRDVDYFTVWEYVLIPLIEEFRPEIILVSSGFDAAEGDTLGQCCVTPGGFAKLLEMLMRFGPIVMVLEGGYNLESISKSAATCIRMLLGDRGMELREKLRPFWKAFESEISEEVYLRSTPFVAIDPLGSTPGSAKAEGSRRAGRSKKSR